MEATPKFRHELKYLIDEGEAELLRQRFCEVLESDPHTQNGEYFIRSLYFDDYWNTAYNEKMAGTSVRKKYRIRIYNCSREVINLECKIKNGNYILKKSARITYDEYMKIYSGDVAFLLEKENNLCREFYFEYISHVLRPRVIVDYEREPFIMEPGDVRITFDKNVRSASSCGDIFSNNLPSRYVLPAGKLVMEVKFTKLLPGIVKRLLQTTAAEHVAVSKYVLCCDVLEYANGLRF